MARRRQRRRREKEQRHPPKPGGVLASDDSQPGGAADRLVYSREQAAQVLGISLATLDRRVIPAIATVKTNWGARLIPVGELNRYLRERTEEPRTRRWRAEGSGRKPNLPPDVVARIRREDAQGVSLAQIARRLNRDDVPTAQGGRQWWPSTVRAVLRRSGEIAASR